MHAPSIETIASMPYSFVIIVIKDIKTTIPTP
jgi:hypothetical protein